MRWDRQQAVVDAEERLPGLGDAGAVVRTFDAPEALNMRFHEVRARSAINRVPVASRVPFEWTVNPYRGCTHACTYCLAGDTRVLMADGSTRPIAALRVGDLVVGTSPGGDGRRFVATPVLDHWATIRYGFRVRLEDGTEIVSSGDHRFLTADGGWKHVARTARTAAALGPYLDVGDRLAGVGRALFGSPVALAVGPVRGGPRGGVVLAPGGSLEQAMAETAAATGVVGIERLGSAMRMFDITTGSGDFVAEGVVSHNCFARPTHTYLELDAGRDFEREIVVKVNIPEVLRAELARPSWKGEHVAMGTNTDPYQWVEGRYKLMRGIWEAFRDAANPCSVLTKSPLLLRDVDLMKQVARRTTISAALSIPTMEPKAWRATEPGTPNPRARMEAVAELNRQGIPCGVLIAPLMPGINDGPGQVEKILELASEAGATSVGGQPLFLRGETRAVFMDWLRHARPDLVPRYERLYARGAYVPEEERRRLEARLAGAPGVAEERANLRFRQAVARRQARRRAEERRKVAESAAAAPGAPVPGQEALF